jgi:hypothetical protein
MSTGNIMITNYFSPLEFIVTVKRMPNVQFFTQRATIPSVTKRGIDRQTPFKTIYETGDQVSYSELNLTFIVDEQMNNYIEVFDWIKGLTFPENFDQFKKLSESDEGLRSDISIVVKNSSKNPSIVIDYFDCFPIALSEVLLDTTQNDVIYPEVTVTFQYNYFSITHVN